jgi:hypothetical protein
MSEPLPLARFRELADAYGGVIARWPEAHRDAAMHLARLPEAQRMLADASALDAALDRWRVPVPSIALQRRVLAGAAVRGSRFVRRARLWWSGIGIAAALGGAVAGSAAVAMIVPIDASDSATSFGDVAAQDN